MLYYWLERARKYYAEEWARFERVILRSDNENNLITVSNKKLDGGEAPFLFLLSGLRYPADG